MTTATVHIYWENGILVFAATPSQLTDGEPFISLMNLGRQRYRTWGFVPGVGGVPAECVGTLQEAEAHIEQFVQKEIFGYTPEEDDDQEAEEDGSQKAAQGGFQLVSKNRRGP